MKIAKFIKLSLIAVLILSSFMGCKKDTTNNTPKIPIEGKWTATFVETNPNFIEYTPLYLTFINLDGEVQVRTEPNSVDFYKGQWFLTNNTALTATMDIDGNFGKLNLMGTYNSTTGNLTNGTFGLAAYQGDQYKNGGSWTMTKDKVQ